VLQIQKYSDTCRKNNNKNFKYILLGKLVTIFYSLLNLKVGNITVISYGLVLKLLFIPLQKKLWGGATLDSL
jgi:hypothetical protein